MGGGIDEGRLMSIVKYRRESLYVRDPNRQLMMDIDLRVARGSAQGKCWGCCSTKQEDREWAFQQVIKLHGVSKHCDKRWNEALCHRCKAEIQVELAARLVKENR